MKYNILALKEFEQCHVLAHWIRELFVDALRELPVSHAPGLGSGSGSAVSVDGIQAPSQAGRGYNAYGEVGIDEQGESRAGVGVGVGVGISTSPPNPNDTDATSTSLATSSENTHQRADTLADTDTTTNTNITSATSSSSGDGTGSFCPSYDAPRDVTEDSDLTPGEDYGFYSFEQLQFNLFDQAGFSGLLRGDDGDWASLQM